MHYPSLGKATEKLCVLPKPGTHYYYCYSEPPSWELRLRETRNSAFGFIYSTYGRPDTRPEIRRAGEDGRCETEDENGQANVR